MRPSNKNSFHLFTLFSSIMFCSIYSTSQTFEPGETINGHNFTGKVNTFDADLDGDLDVLAFPYLYFNNGKGRKEKVTEIVNPKIQYEDYAIEDIDGDKDIDLVVLYKNGEMDIFTNEINGFIKKIQNNKITYSAPEYAKLYLFDVNSDGIRDIIIIGIMGSPMAYIRDKNQQYTFFKQFSDQFSRLNLVLNDDVNKDGIQELLVSKSATDMERNPSLIAYSFKENSYVIIANIELTTDGIDKLKLADIDKDGDLDLVYCYGYPDGAIYWIERNSKGGFGKTNILADQLTIDDFQLGDFDSDGDLDFTYFSRKNQYTSIHWAKNSGNNVFISNHKSLLPNIKDSQKFFFEDFDGDRRKDVLFYYHDNERIRPRYNMILQDKNGRVKEQNTWMTSPRCSGLILTDLDTNGTKDIVGYYNNELFYILNGSNQNYAEAQELVISSFKIENLQCKDLNNDGKDDLIISTDDRGNGKVGYFKNKGALQFNEFTIIHEEKERLINYEILDYDNNGTKDMIVNYWKDTLRGIYQGYRMINN